MQEDTPAAAAEPPAPAAEPAAAPGPHELPVRFVGSGSEYFRIWIVNLLLTLVTLGLYYPFAKVRRLRYFHNATEVGGSPLAFHGDPWKMFRGYVLVALLFAAYSGAGHFSPMAGGIAFVIIALLWPALWHSSMRFRLANIGWRGLRLRYTGHWRGAYAVMGVPMGVAALSVLGLLVVGGPTVPGPEDAKPQPPTGLFIALALLPGLLAMLLMPLFFWLLKRQQHKHYALGAERTTFTAPLGSFYGLAFKTFGVGLVTLAVVFAAILGAGMLAGALGRGGLLSQVLFVLGMVGAYLFMFAMVGGFWTARLQDLVWGRTASAHLQFVSRLSATELAGLWLKNAALVLVTLGLYFPFAQVASAQMRLQAVRLLATLHPDELVAGASGGEEAAAGDAAGDLLGFDIGL